MLRTAVPLRRYRPPNRKRETKETAKLRLFTLLLLSITVGGCDLIGDVFQAGLVVGLVSVVLIVAAIAWMVKRFRR